MAATTRTGCRPTAVSADSRGLVNDGDRIIITKGDFSGIGGGTNAMKIVEVGQVAGEAE